MLHMEIDPTLMCLLYIACLFPQFLWFFIPTTYETLCSCSHLPQCNHHSNCLLDIYLVPLMSYFLQETSFVLPMQAFQPLVVVLHAIKITKKRLMANMEHTRTYQKPNKQPRLWTGMNELCLSTCVIQCPDCKDIADTDEMLLSCQIFLMMVLPSLCSCFLSF